MTATELSKTEKRCPSCDRRHLWDWEICPFCLGESEREVLSAGLNCIECESELDQLWSYCAFCGTSTIYSQQPLNLARVRFLRLLKRIVSVNKARPAIQFEQVNDNEEQPDRNPADDSAPAIPTVIVQLFAIEEEHKRRLECGEALGLILVDDDGQRLLVNSEGKLGTSRQALLRHKTNADGENLYQSPYPDERQGRDPAKYTERLLTMMGLEPEVDGILMNIDWSPQACQEVCEFITEVGTKQMNWKEYERRMLEFTGSDRAPNSGNWSRQRILDFFEAFAFEFNGDDTTCKNPLLKSGYSSVAEYTADPANWVHENEVCSVLATVSVEPASHKLGLSREMRIGPFVQALRQLDEICDARDSATSSTHQLSDYVSVSPSELIDIQRLTAREYSAGGVSVNAYASDERRGSPEQTVPPHPSRPLTPQAHSPQEARPNVPPSLPEAVIQMGNETQLSKADVAQMFDVRKENSVKLKVDWQKDAHDEILAFLWQLFDGIYDWPSCRLAMVKFTGSERTSDGKPWSRERILDFFRGYGFYYSDGQVKFRDVQSELDDLERESP